MFEDTYFLRLLVYIIFAPPGPPGPKKFQKKWLVVFLSTLYRLYMIYIIFIIYILNISNLLYIIIYILHILLRTESIRAQETLSPCAVRVLVSVASINNDSVRTVIIIINLLNFHPSQLES